MPNTQVRRRGAYAPLAATYFVDDDVMEAGEEAELLFVRGLAFCAGNPASDGYITDKQVARVVGAGMSDLAERVQALVQVGLWERLPGGYNVRSWLKWNKSAVELGRHRARDRDRKSGEKVADPQADEDVERAAEANAGLVEFQTDSDDVPHGIHTEEGVEPDRESTPDSEQGGIRNDDTAKPDSVPLTQHNTTQQDSQKTPWSPAAPATDGEDELSDEAASNDEHEDTPNPRSASYWDRVDLNHDPDFMEFWTTYPRRVAKGAARKAWRSIMKKGGVEAAAIIAGAAAYRDDPKRKSDISFTAHPASWLNAERWADYDEPDLISAGNSDEWWNN